MARAKRDDRASALVVRVSTAQRAVIDRAAAEADMAPSTWLREIAMYAASASPLGEHLTRAKRKAANLRGRS